VGISKKEENPLDNDSINIAEDDSLDQNDTLDTEALEPVSEATAPTENPTTISGVPRSGTRTIHITSS
jgi:hypothetical protein